MSTFKNLENFYYLLHPRPVVLIVTCNKDQTRINVMAASWITPIAEDEPTIGVAIAREHFTRKLLDEVPEFTVNIPSLDLLDKVWKAGTVSGRSVDKAKVLGLHFAKSRKVRPPIIEECIGFIEAKVRQVIPVGEVDFIIADVVEAYVKSQFVYKESYIDIKKARPLLHVAGRAFTVPGDLVFPKE